MKGASGVNIEFKAKIAHTIYNGRSDGGGEEGGGGVKNDGKDFLSDHIRRTKPRTKFIKNITEFIENSMRNISRNPQHKPTIPLQQ